MDKSKKKTSIFDEEIEGLKDFWSNQIVDGPTVVHEKTQVHVKSKSILAEYSTRWLILSSPVLYLSTKKKKDYKCLNLHAIPCKLYEYTVERSKYPYKLVLRHHNMSFDFYFENKSTLENWTLKLRGLCLMCDFTTVYKMGNLLTKSSLFRMYWAQSKQTGKPYMAKVYNLQDDADVEDGLQEKIEKQVIINEVRGLRAFNHPNIVKIVEVHEFQGRVVILQEFIGGSSLLKHILSQGSLPEVETVHIMKTLLLVLKELQDKRILHRNLKPENISLDHTPSGTQLKLGSFGFSCSLNPFEQGTWFVGRNICTKCGTPGYMAPELLSNKQSILSGDIFSMGVILYTCLMGEPMFKGRDAEDIISKNLKVSFDKSSQKWMALSEHAKDLILKMTHIEPSERPTIDAILRHPFFMNKSSNFLGTALLKSTWHSTGESEYLSKMRRSSIEESLARQEMNQKTNVDKALQSLIVSPTYFDFSKSDVPEVPEFYIDSLEYLDEQKAEPTKGLKIEIIRGSLLNLDNDERTPTFKIKHSITDVTEEGSLCEEEDFFMETDESVVIRNFKKFMSFPTFQHSPFLTQKPIVQKFKTLNFKKECHSEPDGENDALSTARKLPELRTPARKKLTLKFKLLEDLQLKGLNCLLPKRGIGVSGKWF